MKKIIIILLLLTLNSFSQYGKRYLQDTQVTLVASQDTVLTFTNPWYNVTVFTLDDSVWIELGDGSTTLDSTVYPLPVGGGFTLGEKTPLKKCYISNLSADSSTVYFIGDKSTAE